MNYILIKYLHFISIFGMLSFLVAELCLVKPTLTRGEIKRINQLDGLYGLFSMLAVGAGLLLWFVVGKPAEFYYNAVFYVKIGIVTLVGLLSIGPTVFYFKQRKGHPDEGVKVPDNVRNLIRLQLALLVLVPLFAVMMANGWRF